MVFTYLGKSATVEVLKPIYTFLFADKIAVRRKHRKLLKGMVIPEGISVANQLYNF
jgi:hypothetical protein